MRVLDPIEVMIYMESIILIDEPGLAENYGPKRFRPELAPKHGRILAHASEIAPRRRRVQYQLTPSEGCVSLWRKWQDFLTELDDADAGVCDEDKKRADRIDDDAGRCVECRTRKSSLGDF